MLGPIVFLRFINPNLIFWVIFVNTSAILPNVFPNFPDVVPMSLYASYAYKDGSCLYNQLDLGWDFHTSDLLALSSTSFRFFSGFPMTCNKKDSVPISLDFF